jgi:nucleotide-binding universal stress UspA family protein
MRTIIAPTNFSQSSIHAVNYAADMALNMQAELVLLHVVEMPVSFDVPLTQYEYDTILQEAEEELDELKNDLLIRTEEEITISTSAVFSTMQNQLAELAEEKKPFIIVIGTEKENAAERYFFGSNTFNIAKNQHYPVIIVPQNAIFRHIKRIGLATGLTDIFEIPVETIRTLVEIFDASLDIIHVCKNSADGLAATAALAQLTERLQEFDPEVHFVINSSVEEGLNNYAKQNNEDILLVVPGEHGIIKSLFHKSHSKQMALHTAVPLLVAAS